MYKERIPIVSAGLVMINVVLFLICTFTGNLVYNMGSFSVLDLQNGDYYRIFTSMFLHADIQHLINNMLILYGVGMLIEKEMGNVFFLPFYLLSGLGGNLLSGFFELRSGMYYRSIGASGAVFGMDGMLLALLLFSGHSLPNVTTKRVLIMIALSLYSGFTSYGVNNYAHVGGLMTGFVLTSILCVIRNFLQSRRRGI